MESGNDATKKMAQVVLLDSQLWEDAVNRGRRARRVIVCSTMLARRLFLIRISFHFVGYLSDALSLYLSPSCRRSVFDQWF